MDPPRRDNFYFNFLQSESVEDEFVMASPTFDQGGNAPQPQADPKNCTRKPRGENCSQTQTSTKRATAKPREKNYDKEEDLIIINGWLSTSVDAINCNEQTWNTFWGRVHLYYHECKKPDRPQRTRHSLEVRWSTILKSVNKFCGCLAQIQNLHLSGHTEADKIEKAKITYKDTWNKEFLFEYCWKVLRYQPKWILKLEEESTKNSKKACDSQPAPETIEIGDDCERPPGRKAEKVNVKKRKQKEEKAALFEKVVSSLKEERKQLHDEKMEKLDLFAQIEERKLVQNDRLIVLAEKKRAQKEIEKNDKFMLMDITGMDVVQQEFIQKRRLVILQNMQAN